MSKNFFSRLSNIGKIKNRAAFSDVDEQITKYMYGSDAFMRILESRYSCHSFSDSPVSDTKLEMILNAGILAPSAKNLQPTRIWVVKSEEALAKLRTVHPCYNAPVVLIVGCRNEEAWIRESDGVNAAKTDAAITKQMRAGNVAVIKGKSSLGTLTTDTFSLKGFTKANDAIAKACPRKK